MKPRAHCTCACHHTPGMRHIMPCCYDDQDPFVAHKPEMVLVERRLINNLLADLAAWGFDIDAVENPNESIERQETLHHMTELARAIGRTVPLPTEPAIRTTQQDSGTWVAWTPAPSGLRDIHGHGATEAEAIAELTERVARWNRLTENPETL